MILHIDGIKLKLFSKNVENWLYKINLFDIIQAYNVLPKGKEVMC